MRKSKKIEHQCEYCGNSFKSIRMDARYCSSSCRVLASKSRKKGIAGTCEIPTAVQNHAIKVVESSPMAKEIMSQMPNKSPYVQESPPLKEFIATAALAIGIGILFDNVGKKKRK